MLRGPSLLFFGEEAGMRALQQSLRSLYTIGEEFLLEDQDSAAWLEPVFFSESVCWS